VKETKEKRIVRKKESDQDNRTNLNTYAEKLVQEYPLSYQEKKNAVDRFIES